jgi:dTMP kinase
LGKGKIVVIEGTDKAGKRTQSRMLADTLKRSGKICVNMDFPDYNTPIGAEIKAFLTEKHDYPTEVKHLLLSANRWEKKIEIENMLENGTIIIMNRYYHSNLVYGISNGMHFNWLLNLDKGLPKADIVIVLEISLKISEERTLEGRDFFEGDKELMNQVYKNYRKLARKFKWKIINGENDVHTVHQQLSNYVKKKLKI